MLSQLIALNHIAIAGCPFLNTSEYEPRAINGLRQKKKKTLAAVYGKQCVKSIVGGEMIVINTQSCKMVHDAGKSFIALNMLFLCGR